MNTRETGFDLREVSAILLRSRRLIATIVVASAAVFLVASFVLPKTYKASGVLAIQTDYFRFPLIEDFIPSPTDPSEISAKRDAMVRAAFSREFLDKIGAEYGLLKTQPGTLAREQEQEDLFKRFEIFSLSPATMQIGFKGSTAEMAQKVAQAGMNQVIETFREQRIAKIVRARDNILEQTERMALKKDPTKAVLASRNPEVLRAELNRLDGEIATLTKHFSSRHPDVVRLTERAAALKATLDAATRTNVAAGGPLTGLNVEIPQTVTTEVYDGLVKKLAYLNIALSMEADSRGAYVSVLDPASRPMGAAWPNKPLFLAWGLLFGLVLSSLVLLARELVLNPASRVRRFASEAGMPFLGEMPRLPRDETTQGTRSGSFPEGPTA